MTENPNAGQPIQNEGLNFDPADFSEAELNATDDTNSADQQPAPKNDKLKVKFNGEEKEVSIEEAITLAQKGMNYDHVKGELDNLKNSEEVKTLAELAKENGFKTGKEYLDHIRENARQAKVNEIFEQLKAEGVPEAYAKELAEAKVAAPKQKEPDTSPFLELFKKFPETAEWKDLDAFPTEVRDAVKNGENPVVAYSLYKAQQAEAEKAKVLADQDARQRTPGSLNSDSDAQPDPFLAGFWGK